MRTPCLRELPIRLSFLWYPLVAHRVFIRALGPGCSQYCISFENRQFDVPGELNLRRVFTVKIA